MQMKLTPMQQILVNLWCWDVKQHSTTKDHKTIEYIIIQCCNQTATVFYYTQLSAIHYVVLYPWAQWTSGIFDYKTNENAEIGFEQYITELVQCEIAVLNTPSQPTFKNYHPL